MFKLKQFMLIILLVFAVNVHADQTAKQEKIAELVGIMNMDSMMDSVYGQLEGVMQGMAAELGVKPNEQALFDTYYKKMLEMMRSEISWDKLKPAIVDVYDRNFSEQEITDLITFYKTDTGQSLLKKMPAVMQESMSMSQGIMQGAIPKLIELTEELEAELQKARAE